MDVKEIQTELVGFVCRNFLVEEGEFAVDRSLIDQGIIDSFGLVEIAAHLRKKYGVETKENEMNRDNFGSILKMAEYARRKGHA
jgi:acyl carrier protein